MKEIDDTPATKSESETLDSTDRDMFWMAISGVHTAIGVLNNYRTENEKEIEDIDARLWKAIAKIEALELRVAKLESRRILQADPNDDEEWY